MNNIQKHFNHIINYDLINKLNLKNIFKIPNIDKIILNIGLKNSNTEKKKDDFNYLIVKINNKSTNFNY